MSALEHELENQTGPLMVVERGALLCFFCAGEVTACDCGKFDAVTDDPITPDGQRRIDAAAARREYLRKNPPAVCVEKSSKGMTCEDLSYYAGSRCRSCRHQHNAKSAATGSERNDHE